MNNRFDEHLFRVSSLSHIMPGAVFTKDLVEEARSKYISTFQKYKKYDDEYQAIANKSTKTAQAKEEQALNTQQAYQLQKDVYDNFKKNIDKVELSDGCKTHL